MSTPPAPQPPLSPQAQAQAQDKAALAGARAAQDEFAARHLRDLPATLAPAFRFDPHG
jgi:hypothetical protein